MVVELLSPPAVWIQLIQATQGVGGLAHTLFKAAVEGFCLVQKINVEINTFFINLYV
jgi:hypothetical protein